MPVSLTLQDIPDDVFRQLEAMAAQHRRSLSSEAIACLATAVKRKRLDGAAHLDRIRAITADLDKSRFHSQEIDRLKRSGCK